MEIVALPILQDLHLRQQLRQGKGLAQISLCYAAWVPSDAQTQR